MLETRHPLSGSAASPSLAAREGDGTIAAGRPLLGAPGWGSASGTDCGGAYNVMEN